MRLRSSLLLVALLSGCMASKQQAASLTQCQDDLQYALTDNEVTTKAALWAENLLAGYTELAAELRAALNDDALKITVRSGRMVVRLPTAVYFERGKVELQPEGKAILDKIAATLKDDTDRRFLIAAHTDSEPISAKSPIFKSNLELSVLRAAASFDYLVSQGMDPKLMAATGYGEYMPAASNDTLEGKALNRRLEIIILPADDDLVDLPKKL